MARNQFVVPQFLDIEPRIIGPITVRQFLIILAVVLLDFVFWSVFLNILYVAMTALPVSFLGIVMAFGKVNGQPMHIVVLNIIQNIRRPSRRVWDKHLSDQELRQLMKKEEIPVVIKRNTKAPLEESRLSELTLVVNTGGVYAGED